MLQGWKLHFKEVQGAVTTEWSDIGGKPYFIAFKKTPNESVPEARGWEFIFSPTDYPEILYQMLKNEQGYYAFTATALGMLPDPIKALEPLFAATAEIILDKYSKRPS